MCSAKREYHGLRVVKMDIPDEDMLTSSVSASCAYTYNWEYVLENPTIYQQCRQGEPKTEPHYSGLNS